MQLLRVAFTGRLGVLNGGRSNCSLIERDVWRLVNPSALVRGHYDQKTGAGRGR